jgi:ubiquinone/menaquinone biosynthesis C-methylase UbiE
MPPAGPAAALAYAASQVARFAWFYGQYKLAQRRISPAVKRQDVAADMPGTRELLGHLFALFRRDWDNIARGCYALPPDMFPRPDRVLATSRRFFRDLARVDRRRQTGSGNELLRARRTDPTTRALPRYFLRNFHFQTDGYLSAESAALYDYQVEVLFSGGADAMRRQALVPVAEALDARAGEGASLVDIGCGTGRLIGFAAAAWPRLALTGIDLSLPYLVHARRALPHLPRIRLVQANAETLPLASGSVDLATSAFLFHELPARARLRVFAEAARVLKPGGRFILVDSLQTGDVPRFDPLLDFFPRAYHEPYFADYARCDLDRLAAAAGLRRTASTPAFLSKTVVFDKPTV